MEQKPFSQACENNRAPILAVLQSAFVDCSRILEIGSGTGQHAVHFASQLSHLHWYTSDLEEHHAGIKLWLEEAQLPNISPPLTLDVTQPRWLPTEHPGVDGVFTANTTHIMPWSAVERMIAGIGALLPSGGVFCQYGPFNYGGDYTSDSNARFDEWLKSVDPARGIRDFEAVARLAHAAGLELSADHEMPANNRLLVWVRRSRRD